MGFGKTTPILRIFDEAKAKEFYVGFLGFNIDWEHHAPRVYSLRGHNQQSISGGKFAFAEQANNPAQSCISNTNTFPQNRPSGCVYRSDNLVVESHTAIYQTPETPSAGE